MLTILRDEVFPGGLYSGTISKSSVIQVDSAASAGEAAERIATIENKAGNVLFIDAPDEFAGEQRLYEAVAESGWEFANFNSPSATQSRD